MGKKVIKLFMETMLRAAVIILGIGIIIMVALLIKTSRANKEVLADKNNSTNKDIVTEADDPDDPTFNNNGGDAAGSEDGTGNSGDIKNADILVINATGTGGVAGSWRDTLQSEGYTSVEVGNYLPGTLSTTKVCVSGGYDASGLAGKFTSPEMSTVDALDAASFDVTISDYDIVIVVGTGDISH